MKANIHIAGKGSLIFLFCTFSFFLCIRQSHAQADLNQTKLIKRILVFTFKTTSVDSIKQVNNACIELSKISSVKAFEWGIIESGNESKPVKHIYVFGYTSEKDIEAYEKSPQHDKLVKVAKPVLDNVEGFDYWAKL